MAGWAEESFLSGLAAAVVAAGVPRRRRTDWVCAASGRDRAPFFLVTYLMCFSFFFFWTPQATERYGSAVPNTARLPTRNSARPTPHPVAGLSLSHEPAACRANHRRRLQGLWGGVGGGRGATQKECSKKRATPGFLGARLYALLLLAGAHGRTSSEKKWSIFGPE